MAVVVGVGIVVGVGVVVGVVVGVGVGVAVVDGIVVGIVVGVAVGVAVVDGIVVGVAVGVGGFNMTPDRTTLRNPNPRGHDMNFDLCGTPWQHQLAAFGKAKDQDYFALFFQPGTGKTFAAIMLARYKMFLTGERLRTVVLAPPVVLKNWKDEILAHSPFKPDDIVILDGPGKRRKKVLSETKATIVITNYESLTMAEVLNSLLIWKPEIVIADESHRIKSIQAKRTKGALKLGAVAKYRYLLTGTPILNSPLDLFSQFLFLDRGATFGANFYAFRGKYFYDANAHRTMGNFALWKMRKGAVEDCSRLIANRSMHVNKADCLDLPPLVRKRLEVEMSPEQETAYLQIANDLITYINDKACVARIALTRALRLQQCVSGFLAMEGINGEETTRHKFEDNPRKKALRDLIEDIAPSSKILVWCVFKENYNDVRDICSSLGLKFVEIHGDVSTAEKHRSVERFNTEEDIRVLIGHPGSGGIGVNLVASDTMIFYSRGFSLEFDIQAEARNYRGGSERHQSITRYDIVTPDTIDDLILKRLAAKGDMGDELVKHINVELKNALNNRRNRRNGDADASTRNRGSAGQAQLH